MCNEDLKQAFDWIVFGENLFPEAQQKSIFEKMKIAYPDVYQQWREENKEVLLDDYYACE